MAGIIEAPTPKEIEFSQLYLKDGNAMKAFREVYDKEGNLTQQQVKDKTKMVKKRPRVAKYIKTLQQEAKVRNSLKLDWIVKEWLKLLKDSKEANDRKMVATALREIGKIGGIYEVHNLQKADHSNQTVVIMYDPNDPQAAKDLDIDHQPLNLMPVKDDET